MSEFISSPAEVPGDLPGPWFSLDASSLNPPASLAESSEFFWSGSDYYVGRIYTGYWTNFKGLVVTSSFYTSAIEHISDHTNITWRPSIHIIDNGNLIQLDLTASLFPSIIDILNDDGSYGTYDGFLHVSIEAAKIAYYARVAELIGGTVMLGGSILSTAPVASTCSFSFINTENVVTS